MKIIENGADTIIEDWGEGSGLQILDRDNPVMMTPPEMNIHYLSVIIVLIVCLNLLIISIAILICRLRKNIFTHDGWRDGHMYPKQEVLIKGHKNSPNLKTR